MTADSGFRYLSDKDRERLNEAVRRYTAARDAGGSVELLSFLPPSEDPLRPSILEALICQDLKERWKDGEHVVIETYIERYPELGTAQSISARLVYREYCIRRDFGAPVPLSDYERRFPGQFAELQRAVEQEKGSSGTLLPPSARHDSSAVTVQKTFLLATESDSDTPPPGAPAPRYQRDATLQVGGGYRLIKRIGRGQFGEVWLAEAPGGIQVAMKVIRFPLGHKMTQQELRALELMKRLRHPFLLSVQAYWVLGDQLLMVLELADGSLSDRYERVEKDGQAGIPRDELLGYLRETAEALDYLHHEHVLHRDVKPANILLLNRHAKVGDFGLARLLTRDDVSVTATSTGTPLYMAPEVWEGKASSRSDQYGLAVMYAELRLGRPPFSGDSMVSIMRDHLERPPDLSGLLENEHQAVLRALSKNPAERYSTCTAFAQAVQNAVDLDYRPRREKSSPQRRILIALLILVVVLPVAGLVLKRIFWPELVVVTRADWTVSAGGHEDFFVSLPNLRDGDVADMRFEHPPPTVSLTPMATRRGVNVRVEAELDAPAGSQDVDYTITGGRRTKRGSVVLTITEPNCKLPPGCEPIKDAGYESVPLDHFIYYKSLRRLSPHGVPVDFVLIPQIRPDDPRTFYIMKNKVWNKLFAEFAESQSGEMVDDTEWRRGATAGDEELGIDEHPDLPVMGVHVEDAHRFAVWLGGLLPTVQQWDKAAGRFDHANGVIGPFQAEKYDPTSHEQIAVNRRDEGPLPVGTASHDVSPFRCRDMAGNGLEWTRTIYTDARKSVPIPEQEVTSSMSVTLRGRKYSETQPLRYSDLSNEDMDQSINYAQSKPWIGFRVVIEP